MKTHRKRPFAMRAGASTHGGVLLLATVFTAGAAFADKADVVAVDIKREAGGAYRFDVTVRHDDKGWNDYADLWRVTGESGDVLGERILAHPHVDEQPFTRSLGGVEIPPGVGSVTVSARSSVDGWGGAAMTIDVPGR